MRLPRKLKKKLKKEVLAMVEDDLLQQMRDFKPTRQQWNNLKWNI